MKHLRILLAFIAIAVTAFGLQAAPKGDFNNDNNVNVGDISVLYSAILSGTYNSNYDLNNDNQLNVGDVSALYLLILNPQQDYDNEEDLFASCYETLQSKSEIPNFNYDSTITAFLRQLFNLNELPTDEVKCSWADNGIYELNTATFNHDLPQATGMWMRLCQSINQCNEYLNSSANHDPQHDAEIRFLRDLYLYYFMDLFGNPPFTTNGDMFTNAPQITRAQAFEFLVNDLQVIEPDLAQPRTNTYGRVDKAAAWMLLARLYLNAEVYSGTSQFEKAKSWAYKVINSAYKLHSTSTGNYSAYQKLFMGDNDTNGAQEEIILPIQYSINDDWSYVYGGTTFLVCSTFFDGLISEYPNGLGSAWAGNRSSDDFIYKFGTTSNELAPPAYANAVGDKRALFYNKGRTNYIRDLSDIGEGFPYAKYISVKTSNPSAGYYVFAETDFPLMRVAEAYLTYAEADAMLNNGRCTNDGLAKLNTLRSRSGATAQSRATLSLIFDEWAREFGYECRRRTDLVRAHAFGYEGNNIANDLWAWKGGYLEGSAIDKVKNIYGIPSQAMELNHNLQQNPGYDVHFPNLSLTANKSILRPDETLYLDWSDITSSDYICYPKVYEIQVSFSSLFTEEDSYYSMNSYSSGKYVVFSKITDFSECDIFGNDFENLLRWYERGHGGNISDDHMVYIRVVGNAAGIGTATSNIVAVSVTGFTNLAESDIWWLIGDCIGDGYWNNTSPATSSSSLVPMLPNGNMNELVYAGYFPAGSNFLILPPQSVGNWFGPILRGGSESGGQFYSPDGSGSNITINNAGYYKITLNTSTHAVTWTVLSQPMVFNTITIPGYHNDWNVESNSMTKLCTVHENHDWVANLDLYTSPYQFKFAAGDWEFNWGASEFPFGKGEFNGSNIFGQSGSYYIYFNDILGTYGAFRR